MNVYVNLCDERSKQKTSKTSVAKESTTSRVEKLQRVKYYNECSKSITMSVYLQKKTTCSKKTWGNHYNEDKKSTSRKSDFPEKTSKN